jgi:RNA polymerase sigma-70 factor, ECF subfamily
MGMNPLELERLYDAHAGALYQFLLALTLGEAETRDALQEVFLKLAVRPPDAGAPRDERAFLRRTAFNVAMDIHRRRSAGARAAQAFAREPAPLFDTAPDPDEEAFRSETVAALATLPPEQRAVVHLKLRERLTFQEIADTLDIPPDTAASRYRYGIEKLRRQLRPLFDEIHGTPRYEA